MKIGQHGKLRAFYFLEKQNRPPFGFLFQLHCNRGDLKSGIDFAGDDQEVFRVILFDQIQIATKVLRHKVYLWKSRKLVWYFPVMFMEVGASPGLRFARSRLFSSSLLQPAGPPAHRGIEWQYQKC